MKNIKNALLLLLTAMIWGFAFVAQSSGGSAVGSFSFNGIRSFIGGIVLIPVIFFFGSKDFSVKKRTASIKGGLICGVILFLASTVQQLGVNYGDSVGKAGFITALYILIVPLLGLFLKRKCPWNVWLGVLLSLVGFYLLCMKGSLSITFSDTLLLSSALLFSLHILTIDHFVKTADSVFMSCIQFFVCGILSIPGIVFFDIHKQFHSFSSWQSSLMTAEAWIAILYAGILSCGVAYTLQIIGQKGMNPTVASLIMSLESVFSALAGWLLLKQNLSAKELLGCLLIFSAIIIAQISFEKKA